MESLGQCSMTQLPSLPIQIEQPRALLPHIHVCMSWTEGDGREGYLLSFHCACGS
jgi:hypothetical protein